MTKEYKCPPIRDLAAAEWSIEIQVAFARTAENIKWEAINAGSVVEPSPEIRCVNVVTRRAANSGANGLVTLI
ncbi:MAG: hypothetical protein ACI9J2_002582 [Saprospiraceae bacterium]|jgi:hypothetical protein